MEKDQSKQECEHSCQTEEGDVRTHLSSSDVFMLIARPIYLALMIAITVPSVLNYGMSDPRPMFNSVKYFCFFWALSWCVFEMERAYWWKHKGVALSGVSLTMIYFIMVLTPSLMFFDRYYSTVSFLLFLLLVLFNAVRVRCYLILVQPSSPVSR